MFRAMQTSSPTENETKWKFAQCFGDKGESDDITEGVRFTKQCRELFQADC